MVHDEDDKHERHTYEQVHCKDAMEAGWEPRCGIERYGSEEIPGKILDEMAGVLQIHKYGRDSAQKCEETREIRSELGLISTLAFSAA